MKYGTVSTAGLAVAAAFGFALAATPAGAAESITVASWGGAYSMSQREAYYKPFTKETGIEVLEDEWQGDLGQIRAQQETGVYKWNVIDGPAENAMVGCDEGFLVKIDYDKLGGRDRFFPGGALDCGVGTITWSTIFAYDADIYPDNKAHPTVLSDLFDVAKFPGQRGLYKADLRPTVEWALIVDGVPQDEVYKVLGTQDGLKRALAFLRKIKDSILWWEAGAQPPQLLADKEVIMSTAWNGRIFNAVKNENKNFKIVWDRQGLEYDYWLIPQGDPKADLAMKFVEYASRANVQKNQSKFIAYGPTTYDAAKLIDPAILKDLPTDPANTETMLVIDVNFWAEHKDEYMEIWNSWLAKL